MKQKCTVCGYVHEGALAPDYKCPKCGASADKFVPVPEAPAKNPYAGTKTEKNLREAFAGESRASRRRAINIHISLPSPRKRAMSR